MTIPDKIGRFTYDDNYMSMYEPYYNIVNKLNKLNNCINVLIVGANDGINEDPTYQVWKDTWNGYFIEPNPYAMEQLQKNRTGSFIPYAVGSSNDILTLYAMTESAAKAYEKVGANGSRITSFNRKHIETRLLTNLATTTEECGLDNMIQPLTVSCKTIETIIRDFDIGHVHLAQVDIEGLEYEVVPQCIIANIDVILWEHSHLSKLNKLTLKHLAIAKGYQVKELRFDTFAYKNI